MLEDVSSFFDDIMPFCEDKLKSTAVEIISFALPIIPEELQRIFLQTVEYVYVYDGDDYDDGGGGGSSSGDVHQA